MSEQVPLSTIAEINPHRGKLPTDIDEASFIAMADVSDTAQWVSRQTRQVKDVKNGYTFFREGDVLVAKITPCLENGKGCHATGLKNAIGFGSTEFHVLRARGNADAAFIFQLTNYKELRQQAAMKMTGSAGQQRVPAQFIADYPVHPFTKLQQSKIAQVLSTLDRAIAQTESLLVKQQKVKAGLMQELLTQGIDAAGNRRNPRTHTFKDTPLGLIPMEWKIVSCSTLASKVTKGTTPSTYGHSYTTSGVTYIRVEAIKADGTIDQEALLKISDAAHKLLSRSELMPGDVLVTIAGAIGRCAVVNKLLIPANCNQAVAIVRPKPAEVLPEYLRLFFSSAIWQNYVLAETVQLAQANISLGQLGKSLVALPPLKEQEQICAVAASTTKQAECGTKSFAKLKSIKAGLMQDLLTGRVSILPLLGERTE